MAEKIGHVKPAGLSLSNKKKLLQGTSGHRHGHAWTSDGPFSLPVDEKAVSWTWCALAMSFPPCLSKKILLSVEEKAVSWT